ncbi:MAG: hypothetical protein MJZ26_04300 [Fibrobacter sp.]|nr:hypothetical protein [Fibrobacter sp.]
MNCKCIQCGKDFEERVGMGLLEGPWAIRARNKIGNICLECQTEIASTKKGRRRLAWWKLKIAVRCSRIFIGLAIVFAALTYGLAVYVL